MAFVREGRLCLDISGSDKDGAASSHVDNLHEHSHDRDFMLE
jgi:hypothetical protein